MKGRMDVLNLAKRVAAKKTKMLQSESMCDDVIKIEPEDELDREKCENEDYITDLTLNDSRDDEPISNDESSENMKDEVFATEIMEDDEEEEENPDLPVFSAIKEESRNTSRISSRENESVRGRVEIKYEDDIEEEEYDSDDESVEHSETNNENGMSVELNPMNYVNGRMSTNISPTGIPYRSCFTTDYFDSSVHFPLDNQMERNDSFPNDMDGDLEGDNKSSDSILLSIVYATINVPFSQVSKFLTAYNLSKAQLSVIRKVRRQVKNRLYAQNCRKRRVAHIKNLANELQQIKAEKEKLCNVQDSLKLKFIDVESRYNQLYAYVMTTLAEQHRNEEFDFCDIDSNMNDSSEETKLLKRKLENEYDELDSKKQKIEQQYEELYEHVFRVIRSRYQNNGLARNGMDSNIDFQLCHMDIVNELAMLNKYYTKNNLQKCNEQMDFESSISVDGSRTSENKLNDFVDFESSVSVDGSRCDESKLNDFIDYESSVDYSTQRNNVARYQKEKKPSDCNEVVTLDDEDTDDESDDQKNEPALDYSASQREEKPSDCNEVVTLDNEDTDDESDDQKNNPALDYSASQNSHTEKQSRIDDKSLIVWSEEEDEENEGDDDDGLDTDIREYMVELCKQKEELEIEKNLVQGRYVKLYEHVLKASEISETEFLKSLLDFCIGLMKPFVAQPSPSVSTSDPGRSSLKLNGS